MCRKVGAMTESIQLPVDEVMPRLHSGTKLLRIRGKANSAYSIVVSPGGLFLRGPQELCDLLGLIDGLNTWTDIQREVCTSRWITYRNLNVSSFANEFLFKYGLLAPCEEHEKTGKRSAFSRLSCATFRFSSAVLDRFLGLAESMFHKIPFAITILVVALLNIFIFHWMLSHSQTLLFNLSIKSALLVMVTITLVSIIVHEIGHIVAARNIGLRPDRIHFPFGSVLTSAYVRVAIFKELDIASRLLIDVGGVFLEMSLLTLLSLASIVLGHPLILMAAVLCMLSAITQLLPFPNSDGYWIVSDILGIESLGRDSYLWTKRMVCEGMGIRRQRGESIAAPTWAVAFYVMFLALCISSIFISFIAEVIRAILAHRAYAFLIGHVSDFHTCTASRI